MLIVYFPIQKDEYSFFDIILLSRLQLFSAIFSIKKFIIKKIFC